MERSADLLARLTGRLGADSAAELLRVLAALRGGAEGILRESLTGVHLTGSFAAGHGDEASDVDFLVVADRSPTPGEEGRIRRFHAAFPDRAERWASRLEGSWVDVEALRDPVGAHEPWLYVDNGSREMEHSRHDDTWNGRWTLRETGVALAGPSAAALVPPVARGLIRAEAVVQAAAKAAWIREDPAALSDGWARPYVVLTLCRLLWSATTGTVAGKSEAAEWALRGPAPERFHDLLRAAIVQRLHVVDPALGGADARWAGIAEEFVVWAHAETARRAEERP
ncbi:aminoglycoside adenylyltransferase domain-containing protein [Rathayibacter sp. VKM Ac-2760]|uniref:aminoglycoside adenylyltransferase domain-containing protein n=1 Tax=Rathayibacter sp. VKM Ac-2760 TaxID=2609253 RepID=UPI001318654E|nr:aminoglycoside adenylyltransferase domain-containing protein [Rathayibacter sp. VKM Ac-2760]QHC60404.1 DUF4111 domain-containing protein [Rathayibacter sp. VKM Ac-2760]